MRLRRIAVWSILALFLSLTAMAAWLWTADLGFAKPQVERWVSEQTGREFAIDGKLSVDLAAQSVVIVENIRFSNADWADAPQMLTVSRAEVRFDLWSLFNGPVLIDLIDIDDTEIRLTAREDDDPNWVLDMESKANEQVAEDEDEGFAVLIRQIDIDRVHMVFESPQRTGPLDLSLEYFDQHHRADDVLDIRAKATLNGRQIAFDGEVGEWGALLDGKNIHYKVGAQIDSFELSSAGWIDDVVNPSRPILTFAAKGPDIDDLTKMLGLGDEGFGDIDISGSLGPADDGSLVLDVKGHIGQTNIEASGALSDLQNLNEMDINLLASGPDLGRLSSLAGIHLAESSPFMINVDAERRGPMLVIEKADMTFGEARLEAVARIPNFPSLDDSRIKLALEGKNIERFRFATGLPGAATGAFSLDFEIDVSPSGVELIQAAMQTSLGQFKANGSLGDAPKYFGSELSVELKIDSLAKAAAAFGVGDLPDESAELTARVSLTENGIQILEPLLANTKGLSISIDGLIPMTSDLAGSELDFNLSGPNLGEFATSFGATSGVPNERYSFGGHLQIDKKGYRFGNVAGVIGTSSINVDALLLLRPGLQGSNVQFVVAGPALEELVSASGDIELRPGPFELSGRVELRDGQIDFKKIELDRNNGEAALDLELGLPLSRRWVNFNLHTHGQDIRSVMPEIANIKFDEAPFSVDARGELRGSYLSIDSLEVTLGDARVQVGGDLELSETGRATSFRIRSNIPSLGRLGQFNGRRFREQSISLDANLTGSQGVLSMDDFSVKMGDSDIRGNLRYQVGDVPRLEVDVFSDSIVFVELLEESASEQPTVSPIADGRLIPDIEIPLDVLQKLNATLDIDIGELRRDALFIKQVDLQVDLRDGVLDVREFGFQGRSGYLRSRAVVQSKDGVGIASFDLMSEKLELGLAGLDSSLSAEFDVQVSLEASGNNLRTLLGGLNGFIYVDLRGGQSLQNSFLNAIYGDLLNEIFNAINPFYESSPTTKFECIIAPILFDSGKITTDPSLFIRTDKLGIVTKPKVNLSTEKLDVVARTTPRKGIVISAGELFNPFIKVTGTLSRPYLAVDEQGVLISGGAAVATGGLSLVAKGLWDRMSRSKDPCSTVAASAIELLGDRFPEFADLPDSTSEAATIN